MTQQLPPMVGYSPVRLDAHDAVAGHTRDITTLTLSGMGWEKGVIRVLSAYFSESRVEPCPLGGQETMV